MKKKKLFSMTDEEMRMCEEAGSLLRSEGRASLGHSFLLRLGYVALKEILKSHKPEAVMQLWVREKADFLSKLPTAEKP